MPSSPVASRESATSRFREVRRETERLVRPLSPEDCVVQSMPDVSPTRWHLAHVSWFFETFVLKRFLPDYEPFHPDFEYLFNSYYNAVGDQFPRPRRGLITRPGVAEVLEYRRHVDREMERLWSRNPASETLDLVMLGTHHEQQHQELMLMDIKHVLSCNPLHPAYHERAAASSPASSAEWVSSAEGLHTIGHDADGFFYDNERPRHRTFVESFELASRLATNGEYLEFIEDGGYRRPELWLADGWTTVSDEAWRAPLYWVRRDGEWMEFTLGGLRPLDRNAPVCHVSYYEADAYATWAGSRLPSEAEWEIAAAPLPIEGNFVEDDVLHPAAPDGSTGLAQMYGDVWEWTRSPYTPYPGFRAAEGAVGEYNGKFMCNQFVLRGGACVTSKSHIRPTYRNFFYPNQRWMFSGIRLAR